LASKAIKQFAYLELPKGSRTFTPYTNKEKNGHTPKDLALQEISWQLHCSSMEQSRSLDMEQEDIVDSTMDSDNSAIMELLFPHAPTGECGGMGFPRTSGGCYNSLQNRGQPAETVEAAQDSLEVVSAVLYHQCRPADVSAVQRTPVHQRTPVQPLHRQCQHRQTASSLHIYPASSPTPIHHYLVVRNCIYNYTQQDVGDYIYF
jgi:hypothetical protein